VSAPIQPSSGKTKVFVSFDIENDKALLEKLIAESKAAGSTFSVEGHSDRAFGAAVSSERMRTAIEQADLLIVICGEHTETSTEINAELATAVEVDTPYFLLWGRRDVMSTKPNGAKPTDGMYSWTPQVLRHQIAYSTRVSASDKQLQNVRKPNPAS